MKHNLFAAKTGTDIMVRIDVDVSPSGKGVMYRAEIGSHWVKQYEESRRLSKVMKWLGERLENYENDGKLLD